MDMTQKNSYTILYQNLATFTMLPQKNVCGTKEFILNSRKFQEELPI